MRRRHAGTQLARDVDGLVLRNAPDAAEQRGEILAVDVLHREEAATVGVAEVVQPADVLVRHLPCDPQLVVKLRQPFLVGRDSLRQKLQGHGLVQREIVGAVHLAHAAASEQGDEAIAAGDDRTWGEAGGRVA